MLHHTEMYASFFSPFREYIAPRLQAAGGPFRRIQSPFDEVMCGHLAHYDAPKLAAEVVRCCQVTDHVTITRLHWELDPLDVASLSGIITTGRAADFDVRTVSPTLLPVGAESNIFS